MCSSCGYNEVWSSTLVEQSGFSRGWNERLSEVDPVGEERGWAGGTGRRCCAQLGGADDVTRTAVAGDVSVLTGRASMGARRAALARPRRDKQAEGS